MGIDQAESIRQDLRAQGAAVQAERNLAAQLDHSNPLTLSGLEYAVQLQADLSRNDAAERPTIPPTIPDKIKKKVRAGATGATDWANLHLRFIVPG